MAARLLRALVALVFVCAGLGVVGLAPAHAAATASISGTVTTSDGGALTSAFVTARLQDPDTGTYENALSWSGTVQGDGTYTVTDLEAGTYRLEFYDGGGYATEYWDGHYQEDAANPIALDEGQSRTGYNAVLEPGGSISGTVTTSDGGALTAGNIGVHLWSRLASGEWQDSLDSAVATDGSYSFDGLAPGKWKLQVDDAGNDYATEYYDGKRDLASADLITVASGQTSPTDVELDPTLAITGTVTDTEDVLLPGRCLSAYRLDPESGEYDHAAEGCSDSNGVYRIPGLQPGTYKVGSGSSGDWLVQWYDGAAIEEDATPVPLSGADATAIDFELVAAGKISGYVTDEVTGDPLEGVYVAASVDDDSETPYASSAYTDSDGFYTVPGLAAEDYRVSYGGAGDYSFEYFEDEFHAEDADLVTVTSGAASPADAELGAPGVISGTVTAGGAGVEWVNVEAFELIDGDWVSGHDSDYTDEDGDYELGGLHEGTYRIEFDGELGGAGTVTEYWQDSATVLAADDVVLDAGGSETADAEVTPFGSISGKVTVGGVALDAVCVRAWYQDDEGDWRYDEESCGDSDYELSRLPAGQYKLEFDPTGTEYPTEWYQDVDTRQAATFVTVEDGVDQTIDADVPLGSYLYGKVTSSNGDVAVPGIEVVVYRVTSSGYTDLNVTTTDAQGNYGFNIPGGTYRLQFRSGQGHVGEWYADKSSISTATSVVLPPDEGFAEANAQLLQGGEVTGTVTGPSGVAVSSGSVRAFRLGAGGSYRDFTETGTDGGSFSLSLPVGTYKLQYSSFRLSTEWWSDKTTEAAADPITVTAGGIVADRNAQLEAGATIAGHVTDAVGDDLEGVTVTAYKLFPDGGSYRTFSDRTDGAGDFLVTGLDPGSYTLRYSEEEHLTEWWQDKPTETTADFFTVPRAGAVTGKDAQLADGGRITGRVTVAGAAYDEGGVEVWAAGPDGWDSVAEVETNDQGRYEVAGLPTGDYKVRFVGRDGLASEWWDDKPTRADADLVPVTAGTTAEDIDAVLEEGTTISGTVTGPGGGAEATVYAYRVGDEGLEPAGEDDTSGNGGYEIEGLSPGSYKLYFNPWFATDQLAPEWWDDELTPALADPITVASAPVGAKDATLVAGAHITGTVTDSRAPVGDNPQVGVTAYRLVDGDYEEEAETSTSDDGTYDLRGLPAGTYKVRFTFDGGGSLYWNGASSLAGATPIPVAASATVPGIGAAFVPPAPISPGTPTISGTPQVGSVLTASTGSWTPSDVAFTYQWRADNAPIALATGQQLTLTGAQVNATITVAVTGTKSSQSETAVSAGVGPVRAAVTPVANTSAPTVSGTPKVGATLTASGGAWTPAGVSLTYQWLSDGSPIAGATGTTYAVVAGQVGRRLSVQVTGSLAGSPPFTAASAATGPVVPGTMAGSKPKLTGTAKVGKVLKLKLGELSPAGGKVKIAWFVNGKKLAGAKGRSLTLTKAQKGRTITAEVTVTLAGYAPLELRTKGVKVS